jgi:hypothetical protein
VRVHGKAAPELHDSTRRWIGAAGRAVAGYYGGLPFERIRIEVRVVDGARISGGRAEMRDEPTVSVDVGRSTSADTFANDWRMTHELVHMALPSVAPKHHWIEEGLATYVEPIARVRAGMLSEHAVYEEWLENMQQGQPEPGDRGLDRTSTWGRTYWGGALFCLSADVGIRAATGNRHGLEHALKAIVAAGGRLDATWPIEQVLETGDRAVGGHVLRELYARMADKPARVDLDRLWKQLGIASGGGGVVLDDARQQSELRRAIVFGSVNPPGAREKSQAAAGLSLIETTLRD